MHLRLRQILSCLAPLALLAACDDAPTSAGTVDETNHSVAAVRLAGEVRTPAGRPLPGVKVAVGDDFAVADSNGHWEISGTRDDSVRLAGARLLAYSWQGQALREDPIAGLRDSSIRRWFTVRSMRAQALDSVLRDSLVGYPLQVKAIGRWWDVAIDSVVLRLQGGPWSGERRVRLNCAKGTISGTILLPWSPDTAWAYRGLIEVWGNGGLAGTSDSLDISGDSSMVAVPRFELGNRLPTLVLGASRGYPKLGTVDTLMARCAAPVVRWEWSRDGGAFVAGDSLLEYRPVEADTAAVRWTVRARLTDGRWVQKSLTTWLDRWSATGWLTSGEGWNGPMSDTTLMRQTYALTLFGSGGNMSLDGDSVLHLGSTGPSIGLEIGLALPGSVGNWSGWDTLRFEIRAAQPGVAWEMRWLDVAGHEPHATGLADTVWRELAVPLDSLRCRNGVCPAGWDTLGMALKSLRLGLAFPDSGAVLPRTVELRRIRGSARKEER